MKQSEEYRSRHSMEVPGKSTEVPGKSTEVPGGCTEVPDNCQELPWSRKKYLYGPGDKSVPVVTPCRNNFGKISPKYLEYAEIFRIFAMSIRTNDI